MDRIAQMGCLICVAPAAIHHVTSDGFKRITRDHKLVAPLCPDHHQYGPEAVHRIGQQAFDDLHGVNLYSWAAIQWAYSNGG